MKRRLLAIVAIAAGALVWSPVGPAPLTITQPAAAQGSVIIAGSTPDDAGNSIGSPNAGPKPQNSGDRGGWAQLLVLGVLATGVSFIMWRIFHDSRGGQNTT